MIVFCVECAENPHKTEYSNQRIMADAWKKSIIKAAITGESVKLDKLLESSNKEH